MLSAETMERETTPASSSPSTSGGEYAKPLFLNAPGFTPPLSGEICRALGPIVHHLLAVVPKGRNTWELHVDSQEIRDRLELQGLSIRDRCLDIGPRFPGGTWVRIRGLPLTVANIYVDQILQSYGSIVVKTDHATWRNTHVKTGERSLKIELVRDIPSRLKTAAHEWFTVKYRNQPELCFSCGKPDHHQWDCPDRQISFSDIVRGGDLEKVVAVGELNPTSTPDADEESADLVISTDPQEEIEKVEREIKERIERLRKEKKKEKARKRERKGKRKRKEREIFLRRTALRRRRHVICSPRPNPLQIQGPEGLQNLGFGNPPPPPSVFNHPPTRTGHGHRE
ncbi:uncharacterized protein LOC121390043 [Gigantopelta aegis]|uniref:uncharacterized protein LOC121390043 n=1 Tax=Gigantopelta aegis TaxID=1735272 RepID=UPI001B88869F|nr:uncharacterized protein LOC121390043 [Gigantopelta aegis]